MTALSQIREFLELLAEERRHYHGIGLFLFPDHGKPTLKREEVREEARLLLLALRQEEPTP